MGLKFTGFDTPIGGVSWEYTKSDRVLAKSLLDFFSGQRILFVSCDTEGGNCQEYSKKSVLKMKEKINTQLESIVDEDDYKRCLRQMRNICNDFLSEPICQKLLICTPHCNTKALCPVGKFRKDIAYYLFTIVSIFNIDMDNDILRVLCSNGIL